MLVVEPLGMAARHAHQPCHRGFCDLREASSGSDTTPCIEMVDDIRRSGLRELGMKSGGPAPFRKLFSAVPTAQQAETILPIDLSDDEVASAYPAKQLAFCIDTG
jgi:hypothetical protein